MAKQAPASDFTLTVPCSGILSLDVQGASSYRAPQVFLQMSPYFLREPFPVPLFQEATLVPSLAFSIYPVLALIFLSLL